MAYTTINKSSLNFNTVTYTGDGNSTQAITNTFQTDFSWIKHRGTTAAHTLQDALRGFDVAYKLCSNTADAENNAAGATWGNYGGVSAVGATSFTVALGSNTPYQTNANGADYVSWNWKAANSAGSANSHGNISSTVSANTTAGFSIVTYTGTGSNPSTVGHGLGVVPQVVLVKPRSIAYSWCMYHKSMGNTKVAYLDTSGAQSGSSVWNNTTPTNQVFTVNDNQVNKSGETHVAYCFAEKTGYSKFGAYDGNGNADGNFVFTGFKPAWIMIKRYESSGEWLIYDNKRDPINVVDTRLEAQDNFADSTSSGKSLDFLSNGFKIRGGDGDINTNGGSYLYMAFGQTLVGTNNIPATAR